MQSLRQRLVDVVAPLVTGSGPAALIDYPNHNNSGDSAIWVGEQAVLAKLGVTVGYTADLGSFNAADLRRAVPEGPVLIHGGGNFGDLWPVHQEFREYILREFADRTVIQLPQTVAYRNPASLDSLFRLAGGRRYPFIVLCRDEDSLSALKGGLEHALLCPDMAFGIPDLEAVGAEQFDVVVIRRSDHEAKDRMPELPTDLSSWETDWLDMTGRRFHRRVSTRARTTAVNFASEIRGDDAFSRHLRRTPMIGHDWLARRRVGEAVKMISTGRVLLTDRLHGHILALLLDKPHVLLADRYGKLSAFHRSFTSASPITTFASDAAEVERWLRDYLPG